MSSSRIGTERNRKRERKKEKKNQAQLTVNSLASAQSLDVELGQVLELLLAHQAAQLLQHGAQLVNWTGASGAELAVRIAQSLALLAGPRVAVEVVAEGTSENLDLLVNGAEIHVTIVGMVGD